MQKNKFLPSVSLIETKYFAPFFFIVFLITFLNNLPEVTWAVWGDGMGCHMCVFG